MIGVHGHMEHDKYADIILSELANKYGRTFEIEQLTYEVSGDKGNFYRAVCREQGNSRLFVAFYYLNGTDYLLADELDLEIDSTGSPVLVDEYLELLLNQEYSEYIEGIHPEILFVVAEIEFVSHELRKEDFSDDLAHCLLQGNFDVLSKVFVFADDGVENKEEFENQVVRFVSDINSYCQSVDVAYISPSEKDAVRNQYLNDTYLIRDRVAKDAKVSRHCWYLIQSDKGVVHKRKVKGGVDSGFFGR